MKKLLFTPIFLLFSLPLFSQSLAYRTENDSILQMGTNYHYEGKTDNLRATAVSLEYLLKKDAGEEFFLLNFVLKAFKLELSFDKGSNLYIKTYKDNLITLVQIDTYYEIKRERELLALNRFYYKVYPRYNITKDDLQKIIKEGIKKMSFMTTAGYYNLSFEEDSLGEIIRNEYNLLLGKSDFTEGF